MGTNRAQAPSNPLTAMGGLPDISKMNPNVVIARLCQSNPDIQQVVDSISGMQPEEAFRQYGLDYNQAKENARMFGINI